VRARHQVAIPDTISPHEESREDSASANSPSPDEAHRLADYVSELTTFPACRHDDQVDSTAQVLAWARRCPSTTGMIDFWAARADGLWPTSRMARVKAPEGVSHVQVLSGAHLVVPADRILELDESDAKPLLAARWMRA